MRVSVQAGLQVDVGAARKALAQMKRTSPVRFEFLADPIGADRLPAYVRKPADLTDGHLLELAKSRGLELATLDDRIPGSRVVSGAAPGEPRAG